MESPLVLLPCAGFGRRVGSPEAKELLPLREGQPLIQQPLQRARVLGWPSLAITRPEKPSLVNYLEEEFPETEVQFCRVTEEWPHTVFESRSKWRTWNLLVLPDTDYSPEDAWEKMWGQREGVSLVVGEHEVQNPRAWGAVVGEGDSLLAFEKVGNASFSKAWGLLLFHRSLGENLFQAFIDSRRQQQGIVLPSHLKANFFALQSFRDLTR